PGPSSSTGRSEKMSITVAILRAVKLLVGTIEPTARGLSIQPLKNLSSSSKRWASDLRGVSAISVSSLQNRQNHFRNVDPARSHARPVSKETVEGGVCMAAYPRSPKESKNTFIREKKPVDCGLFSCDEICSNSCRSSR